MFEPRHRELVLIAHAHANVGHRDRGVVEHTNYEVARRLGARRILTCGGNGKGQSDDNLANFVH